MSNEGIEKIIVELIDKFNIKKKIGYRVAILNHYNLNKDNNNKLLGDIIAITWKFTQEEINENKV